jgi:phenylacetate-CoA ligase
MWAGPVLTLVFKDFDILQYQIIQENWNRIILRIVKGKTFSEKDAKKLIQIFNYHVGEKGSVEIEYINKIPLTKSGKRRFIISKVSK